MIYADCDIFLNRSPLVTFYNNVICLLQEGRKTRKIFNISCATVPVKLTDGIPRLVLTACLEMIHPESNRLDDTFSRAARQIISLTQNE